MATDFSAMQSAPPERTQASPSWLHARALWAGLSIITMWLAVLFVGIFGSDFVSSSSNGFTKFPVVVFLLPFVLPATIVVGRRGFASVPDEQRSPRHKQTQAEDEATAVPSALRAKPVG
ncbi:MAG TPA: hypothetical protein VFI54_24445 [Solirubrobacteraceae bacterium]|nr:hypothetical protein [Solirubrobacteraceae bacterium]